MQITIPNWPSIRHYKDKKHPWVKLSSKLFSDRRFMEASRFHRSLYSDVLMLSAQLNRGAFTISVEDFCFNTGAKETAEVIEDALICLAHVGMINIDLNK